MPIDPRLGTVRRFAELRIESIRVKDDQPANFLHPNNPSPCDCGDRIVVLRKYRVPGRTPLRAESGQPVLLDGRMET